MKHHKYVYFFGNGKAAGEPSMKRLLGGKGANLAGMMAAGIPVPPGFTISTEVCRYFNDNNKQYPEGLQQQIDSALSHVEECYGAKFGDVDNPLLVSVRSGAEMSMPGMMDTVLNLGLNSENVEGLARKTNNPRMAWDSFRRLIDMFGDVVMGVEHAHFEKVLSGIKQRQGVALDSDLSVDSLKQTVAAYLEVFETQTGAPFPSDPKKQLQLAITAVFESWEKSKAVTYRKINRITGLLGTAVNIQAMVFGNMGENSGSGVAFTRNPATGKNEFFGEFLVNAQGEDVVAGIRTPVPMTAVQDKWPHLYDQLLMIRIRLEQRYRDMQDVEFTIQDGTLYMLQTRTGQRTGTAAIQMVIDMVHEHLIDTKEALLRLNGGHINQLLFPVLDPKEKRQALSDNRLLGLGLPAGPGASSAQIVFSAKQAEEQKMQGIKSILVRHETSAEDVSGMWAAEAVLTSCGGMTSHAAVVARGWGKCCIVGFSEMEIDYANRKCTIGTTVLHEGDWISLDGSTGEVLLGEVLLSASPVIAAMMHNDASAKDSQACRNFNEIMAWTDKFKRLEVFCNADTPSSAAEGLCLGAEGLGLVRTEHMFFEADRIWSIREFILAEDSQAREVALKKLLPYQQEDFVGIFRAMKGKTVTIRLLDPPLHEFLPNDHAGRQEMARRLNEPEERVAQVVEHMRESNPMLGHRGCRLSISYPELCEMQITAIIEAALVLRKEGRELCPEIMVPLICDKKEFDYLVSRIRKTANALIDQSDLSLDYKIGTMIEVPRAVLQADKLAEQAEFFSFGTNDLTQMTYGISRDDSGLFLSDYIDKKLVAVDPFEQLDEDGVGALIRIAIENGRKTRPGIRLGLCGEHGGEPKSIKFCHQAGLDYVSCSPYRVPVARLAAAQAAIESSDAQAKHVDASM